MPAAGAREVWNSLANESAGDTSQTSDTDSDDAAGRRSGWVSLVPKLVVGSLLLAGAYALWHGGKGKGWRADDFLSDFSSGGRCDLTPPPPLWKPAGKDPLRVKVLSYNLFWWNLFGIHRGNNGSAGKLIQANSKPELFDFMGFQECEDPEIVLEGKAPPSKHKHSGSCKNYGCTEFIPKHACQCNDACDKHGSCCADYEEHCLNSTKNVEDAGLGLLKDYAVFLGTHAICMGYAKSRWTLLDRGQEDVSEDMPTQTYGTRGAQWMRLKSKQTDRTAFFVNHHGPLSVNSGGICGGNATAGNLVKLMAKNAKPGDLIILVGDFNANAASLTIQGLWPHLSHVFTGDSWGGVDNVFSNCDPRSVAKTSILGSGGSDHDAVEAIIDLGAASTAQSVDKTKDGMVKGRQAAVQQLKDCPSGYDWQKFWCGRYEQDVEYEVPEGAWTGLAQHRAGLSPQWCCRECQEEPKCKSWTWYKHHSEHGSSACVIHDALPSGAKKVSSSKKIVSGMPVSSAIAAASEASKVTDSIEGYIVGEEGDEMPGNQQARRGPWSHVGGMR